MSGSRHSPFCKFKSEKQRTWAPEPKIAHCCGAFLFRFDQLVKAAIPAISESEQNCCNDVFSCSLFADLGFLHKLLEARRARLESSLRDDMTQGLHINF